MVSEINSKENNGSVTVNGVEIKENEVVDDLQIKGYRIIQSNDGFKFGMDAVLLANFTRVKKSDRVADLGTGTGIIPILVAAKSSVGSIDAVEIQPEVCEMANRSVMMNNLEERIHLHNIDLKDVFLHLKKNEYNVVTSNPPYMKPEGIKNINEKKMISRHEVKCNLEDVIKAASGLLCSRGKFFMVHRPIRLCDIMCLGRKYKLETKVVRFVHPKALAAPNMVLVEMHKGGAPELRIEPPLVVYNDDNTYTDEIKEIYSNNDIEL